MAQHLAQRLVNLRRVAFASQVSVKLRLDHVEHGFDIRPLVIGLQKLITLEAIEVIHLLKHSADFASGIRLERDVWNCASFCDGFVVVERTVALIRADLVQLEILGSLIDQCGKHRRIIGVFASDFNRCDDMSFNAAHQVSFDPKIRRALFPVLFVKPTDVITGREAGRINGEIRFDCLQWQAAMLNQFLQKWRKRFKFQVIENAVEVASLRDVALTFCLVQIGHKPSAGNGREDFESNRENHISVRQRRASALRWQRFNDVGTQIVQELLEKSLLVCLRQIVRFPILPVSYFLRYLNRLCGGNGGQVAVSDRADTAFAFNDDFNGIDMLAAFAPFLKIWAGATRRIGVGINFIKRRVIAGGWNAPELARLCNACLCGD